MTPDKTPFSEYFAKAAHTVTGTGYESTYLGGTLYKTKHENGTEEWFRNGQRRLVKYADGGKYWYKGDKVRREEYGSNGGRTDHLPDGTRRVQYPDKRKYYYNNDELHRIDGPAVTQSPTHIEFWVRGKKLTQEQFNAVAPQLKAEQQQRVLEKDVASMAKGIEKPVKPLRPIRLKMRMAA